MTLRELASSGLYVTLLAALDRARAVETEPASAGPPDLPFEPDDDFEDTLPASWVVSNVERKSAAS